MKNIRLPRKRKKQVKKLIAKKTALKITMSAMVSAQTMAQTAMIAGYYTGPSMIADKALSVYQIVTGAKKAIQKIMTEPPNSWRDFVR